ncbi:O-acetyl-ADP-ribose deacetylase [Limosilactobacillus sp. STM2_1]|uniref:O-acetyl-ADP-ribose deacetylase n=1 Tax=Limosilactobacillus rudii TaxID=2759755 RepID=A0A7W3UKP6_9LACO|nr:O-acetyl-ADP-ribose deacetylase [Limosilactobacillus rudii]MBB1079345.1 O-acetyl-ADP-ribose deacetylase [Limosilactobacillus rudii]MBB1097391.1 O-acetyl-ADP-ribose deacetylase [Limosilactobacillus rudii]MCD7134500.1 O-acetyl-ADP-ribose deacetylase [Limosilactobacillus rudii]
MGQIKVIKGDITKVKADAIVNAANTTLMGGGGVDGAIHRAAGPALYGACEKFHGCPTGEARITGGFNLPAKFIIHTPGPVWHGGNSNEDQLLANSYHNSLTLADQHLCETVAFPSISTGVYAFPLERAAEIAIKTIKKFLLTAQIVNEVTMVCFDEKTFAAYQQQIY